MAFSIVFLLAAFLILILVFVIALLNKGWKAAFLAGGITFILLAVAFVVTINIIVSAMSGNGM